MGLQIYQGIFVLLFAYLLYQLHRVSQRSSRAPKFPPGPTTLPFLGNLHQLPIAHPEAKFAAWAREFGALTGLKAGCQNLIVLNTWQAVWDLLEQKGSIYSSRPYIPAGEIIIPGGVNPGLSPYGELWRAQRKKIVGFLAAERVEGMKAVQDAESSQMVWDLARGDDDDDDAEDIEKFVDRSFGAVILATVFGQRGKTIEEGGKLETFFRVETAFSAALAPTASPPIGSFPFLDRVPEWATPWRGWKTRAREVRREQNHLYVGLLNETRERLAQGKGADCFLSQCLKTQDKEWYTDLQLAHLGGVLLEGGAETSAGTTMVFIMTMAAYPEVLKRAQEEVDRVCGQDKMPGKDEINKLPYVRACMQELLRWRPVVTLGVPHHTTAQDTYGDYVVPAGTDVIINTWTINHDESFYKSPKTFDPSRYLQNEFGSAVAAENMDAYKGRRVNYTFGAGRRVCPGQRFAENNLMLHFAKLVWAFDFEATGRLPINNLEEWSEGIISRPKDLKVKLKLRGEERRSIIEKAWLEADAFLQQFE
jgi:cytochrome P450